MKADPVSIRAAHERDRWHPLEVIATAPDALGRRRFANRAEVGR